MEQKFESMIYNGDFYLDVYTIMIGSISMRDGINMLPHQAYGNVSEKSV